MGRSKGSGLTEGPAAQNAMVFTCLLRQRAQVKGECSPDKNDKKEAKINENVSYAYELFIYISYI
jgi:hypothetical protein